MRFAAFLSIGLLVSACSSADGEGVTATPSARVTGTLLVANKRDDTLSYIDLASGEEMARVETCTNPHELSVSPDKAHVALACYGGTTLEIFTTDDLSRVAQIELGRSARPHGVIWHANGMIVASAEGRGSIFVVRDALSDQPQVQEIGGAGDGPHMVTVNATGDTAWGAIIPSGTVVRYDLIAGEEEGRATLGGDTEAIAISANEETLWVGANAADRVFRLNPQTLDVMGSTATGPVPIRVAAHPTLNIAASSDFGSGSLTIIDGDTGEPSRTITVSGGPEAVQVTLIFSEDGERLYAAETRANAIAEIDYASGEVLRRLPTGPGGDGLAVFD